MSGGVARACACACAYFVVAALSLTSGGSLCAVVQFVEGEAEEDEEELANVAGIGNFGVLDKSKQVDLFGKVVEKPAGEAEAEEEAELRVTKDDLDHIVDDLSDGA